MSLAFKPALLKPRKQVAASPVKEQERQTRSFDPVMHLCPRQIK